MISLDYMQDGLRGPSADVQIDSGSGLCERPSQGVDAFGTWIAGLIQGVRTRTAWAPRHNKVRQTRDFCVNTIP